MKNHTPISQQLTSIRDYLRWTISEFQRAQLCFGHGTDNAVDEAHDWIGHCLGLGREIDSCWLDAILTYAERERIIEGVEQRCTTRLPLPYLTGEAWFAGLPFIVDRHVLVPRSPIAELIEAGFEPWLGQRPVQQVLDLCSGSGCIGIACAYLFEEATVDLADLSAEALAVAERNVARHELQHRVQLWQSDLFAALSGRQYDLIVCNPPYVDAEDLAAMPPEYHHEPAMALGSGEDGLDITRRLLAEAASYLHDQGLLVVEVGNSCVALEQAYPQVGFTWVEFSRGGHGVFVLSKEELLQYREQLAQP